MLDYTLKKSLIDTTNLIHQYSDQHDGLNLKEIINIINNLEKHYDARYLNDIACILFEALYIRYRDVCYCQKQEQFFCSELGKALTSQRKQIWHDTYGVPPLNFILKSTNLIKLLVDIFNPQFNADLFYRSVTQDIIESASLNKLTDSIPSEPAEHSGFVPTHNQQGYMTTTLDYFSKSFACSSSKSKDRARLLEIGAAYGIASLEALRNGSTVIANDIDPIHLAIMANKASKEHHCNLQTVTGIFPEELEFPENYFDGALICRVMHFFTAQRIIDSLKILRKVIKPSGKIYIVNETPYLANWSSFIPEYNARKSQGIKWPGIITNPEQYCSSRAGQLPSLVHWLDQDTLLQALSEAGFVDSEVEEMKYINRAGQFPQDILMPSEGRESIGCCITKIK